MSPRKTFRAEGEGKLRGGTGANNKGKAKLAIALAKQLVPHLSVMKINAAFKESAKRGEWESDETRLKRAGTIRLLSSTPSRGAGKERNPKIPAQMMHGRPIERPGFARCLGYGISKVVS